MFVGVVYVTICTGWLCRMIHGEETEINTHRRFTTQQECLSVVELAAEWTIGDEYRWRVVCKEIPK
jgi:hypothetical protein